MPGRLRTHVHVRGEHGITHVFTPHDEIPEWAARAITNPKAWAEPPQLDEPGDAEGNGDQGPEQSDPGASARPAETATKDVWLAYAAVRGLEVAPDATKAQIIAAVTAADQP